MRGRLSRHTLLPMGFAVGDEVLRRSAFGGWENGTITGQIGDSDTWYVTTGPGQTYMSQGRELRHVVSQISTETTGAS